MGKCVGLVSFVFTDLTVCSLLRYLYCQPSNVGCGSTEGLLCDCIVKESSGYHLLKVCYLSETVESSQKSHVLLMPSRLLLNLRGLLETTRETTHFTQERSIAPGTLLHMTSLHYPGNLDDWTIDERRLGEGD